MPARTFAIGDIHGALRALEQVITAIAPQKEDTLIFLGDYVDGWPESAQVIDYLTALQHRTNCIFIKGNHDIHCEEWLKGNDPGHFWARGGGRATVASYAGYSGEQTQQHLDFFAAMKYFYRDDMNRLYIHGGFTSNAGPAAELPAESVTTDRSLWELAVTMDQRVKSHPELFPKRLTLFHEIYIGHTPVLINYADMPVQACNVWNVDTGAGFYGKLSALNTATKEIIQSDNVPTLYPGIKGRS
jgi:serine/threonine protein phosphatase 1